MPFVIFSIDHLNVECMQDRIYSTFDYSYAHRHHRKMPFSTRTPTEIVLVHHLCFFVIHLVYFLVRLISHIVVYFSSESRHRNKYSTIDYKNHVQYSKKNAPREHTHTCTVIHTQMIIRQEFLFSWISLKSNEIRKVDL